MQNEYHYMNEIQSCPYEYRCAENKKIYMTTYLFLFASKRKIDWDPLIEKLDNSQQDFSFEESVPCGRYKFLRNKRILWVRKGKVVIITSRWVRDDGHIRRWKSILCRKSMMRIECSKLDLLIKIEVENWCWS